MLHAVSAGVNVHIIAIASNEVNRAPERDYVRAGCGECKRDHLSAQSASDLCLVAGALCTSADEWLGTAPAALSEYHGAACSLPDRCVTAGSRAVGGGGGTMGQMTHQLNQ